MSEEPGSMNPPEPHSSFRANLQRGELLRDQGRYAEAENYLQQAIGEQPTNAEGYYELAFCYCNWDGHGKKALETIDRAISLDPNQSHFFALRAWILGNLDKNEQAIKVAQQALELNPFSLMALNAQTRAYNHLHDWKNAEAHARRTLALDARNELANNLLAIALRQQGRLQESDTVTSGLLAHVPDNAMAQSNAGWSALQAGDHRRANQHFLEALRLEPGYEYARQGMLHSFNSRVWVYRIYFQFVAWFSKHRTGMRWFFIILVYAGYRGVVTTLRTEFGKEGLNWAIVVFALYFVLFGFGRSFANGFLLLDRFARHALTRKEKWLSLFAVTVYGLTLGSLIASQAWPQAAILIGIVLFFLWGVLVPRFQDARARGVSLN